jgi:O-antigen ligase
VAAIILLVVILGSVYFIVPQSKIGQFIIHATYPFQGAAYEERKETFGYAWQMFKEHKILGNGPGSFGEQAPLKHWEVRQNWKIVNNIYLELLAETGILGFGAMVLFFILLLWFLYKSYRKTGDKLLKILFQGFFLVILGILIQYNTFSIIYLPYVWVIIGVAMATLKLK